VLLGAPQDGRLRARRRRGEVGGEHVEELADAALGREVDHPDRAARPAHAQELVRDCPVVRREHRPDRRRDDVELVVPERQRLGIGRDP
jgi:hypothetical protein